MDGPEHVRFGVFDFDGATGELRREGVLVRLQSQPAKVLALLVGHAGEVVTREALKQAVWGAATFVDFERGLNFCIAQIRAALGDSADSPRFVRTVPKRGYQFIAPVGAVASAPAPLQPRTVTRPSKWLVIPAALFIGLAIFVAWRPWNHKPQAAPIIAVTRFDNETGGVEYNRFTDGLTDALVAELTASTEGRYGVIGNAAILRQPRSQRDLTRIASSLGAAYIVMGQVQRDSSRMRILAHLIRMPDQTHLWVDRLDRPLNLDDPLTAETKLAQQIAADFSAHLGLQPASSNALRH